MEQLAEEMHSNIKDVVKLLPDETKSNSEAYFDTHENLFSKLNTETKWKMHFSQTWVVVDPVELPIGGKSDSRRNRTAGTYYSIPVKDKFAFWLPLTQKHHIQDGCLQLSLLIQFWVYGEKKERKIDQPELNWRKLEMELVYMSFRHFVQSRMYRKEMWYKTLMHTGDWTLELLL